MHLGGAGPALAEFYGQGLTIEQAIERQAVAEVEEAFEPEAVAPELEVEPEPVASPSEDEGPPPTSIAETLSLTGKSDRTEEEPL